MKKTIIITILIFCSTVSAEEKSVHYCDDANGWAEWVALIKKYPGDDDLRTAYALRLGLCQEVKAGTIETTRAVNIFERFMGALKMKAEQEKRMENKSLREKGI